MDRISGGAAADGGTIAAEAAAQRFRLIPRPLERAVLVALQLVVLWALNFAGAWAVRRMALPVPGNLVGLLALYGLLALGIVKLDWFEPAGSFLVRHLAFFYVPITVGLMDSGPLLLAHGLAIMLILVVSAAIGFLLAGHVSQALLARREQRGAEP